MTLDDLPAPGAKSVTVDDLPAPDAKPSSGFGRFMSGFMDPNYGAVQLLARGVPPIGKTRETAIENADTAAASREKEYQASRAAAGKTGFDFTRTAGNLANPLNYIIPGAEEYSAGRAMLQGAAAGAMQPVTEGNYGAEKAKQTGVGAAAGAIVKPVLTAVAAGVGKVADPILNFVKGIKGPDATNQTAVREVLRRVGQDTRAGGPTAQDMLDLLNAAPDKPLTLADLGGANIKALAGRLSRVPGESRQTITKFLTERDLDAGLRLAGDVDKGIGKGSALDAAKTMGAARATAAAPLYEEAFATQVAPEQAAQVQRFVKDKIGQEALQKGMRVIELEHLAANKPFKPSDFGLSKDAAGKFVLDEGRTTGIQGSKAAPEPNLRLFDAVKRGYDEIVEGFRDPTSGRLNLDQYGRAVNDVRAKYVGSLKEMFPKYKAALDSWSGPSQSLDALHAGREFMLREPEEIAERVKGLSAGDKEFFKLGAASALRKSIAKTGAAGDESRKIIGSSYTRQQLRPLFDNEESFGKFIDSVKAESAMFKTKHEVMGGSDTARRLSEDISPENEAFDQAAKGAMSAAHGNFLGSGMAILKGMTTLGRNADNVVNHQISRILTTPLNGSGMKLLREFSGHQLPTVNHLMPYVDPATRGLVPPLAIGAGSVTSNQP